MLSKDLITAITELKKVRFSHLSVDEILRARLDIVEANQVAAAESVSGLLSGAKYKEPYIPENPGLRISTLAREEIVEMGGFQRVKLVLSETDDLSCLVTIIPRYEHLVLQSRPNHGTITGKNHCQVLIFFNIATAVGCNIYRGAIMDLPNS